MDHDTMQDESTLPREYWPCPLTIITLLVAHAQGIVHHEAAFEALKNSGLVQDPNGKSPYVMLTERGRKFVEMLEEVPLPVQKWVDPRLSKPADSSLSMVMTGNPTDVAFLYTDQKSSMERG